MKKQNDPNLKNAYGNTREEKERSLRAWYALMVTEDTAGLYATYLLVVDRSKEFAERVLNTPLA